ncbi:MAG: hypothetical protein J1F33_07220 [Clostridiales bacterium]|nr:hypothetical protein [Clostridiales bacterium]
MTAKEIAEFLTANGITMERGFSDIESLSFASPECHELSDEIVAYLGTLVEHGVNNGFNKSMEINITDLTKICMSLTSHNPKAVKNLAKSRARFAEDKADVKLSVLGPDLQIKANVIKHINAELEALEFLKKRIEISEHLSESSRAIRLSEKEKEIEKLKAIKAIIESAIDNCSVEAAQLADKILDDIIDAAEIISANHDNDKVFALYDSALEKAQKWAARRKSVGKRETVRPEGVTAYNAEADRLAIVTMSIDIEKSAMRFRENLEALRRSKEKHGGYEKLEQQIRDHRAEIDKLEKMIKQGLFEVKSGAKTKAEFKRMAERAAYEKSVRQRKIEELEDQIDERFDISMIDEDLLAKMERINEELERYEDNRIMLYFIGRGVNFVTLTKLMNGEPISKEEEQNIVTMQTVLTAVPQEMRKNVQGAYDRINNVEGLARAKNDGRRNVAIQSEAERAKREAENDAFFAEMEAMYGGGETQEENEESPLREDLDDVLHTER